MKIRSLSQCQYGRSTSHRKKYRYNKRPWSYWSSHPDHHVYHVHHDHQDKEPDAPLFRRKSPHLFRWTSSSRASSPSSMETCNLPMKCRLDLGTPNIILLLSLMHYLGENWQTTAPSSSHRLEIHNLPQSLKCLNQKFSLSKGSLTKTNIWLIQGLLDHSRCSGSMEIADFQNGSNTEQSTLISALVIFLGKCHIRSVPKTNRACFPQ